MSGRQEEKVRFLKFVPSASLLIGTGQGEKGRIMPTVSKKMCLAVKRTHRQLDLFDEDDEA